MAAEKHSADKTAHRVPVLAVLALASAAVVLLLDLGLILRPLELKAYDGLFFLRERFGLVSSRPDSPVFLVEIDDQTFDDQIFQIPQTLWHQHFGAVITGLADAGAKVIGLDFILPQALFDELVPDYSRTWLRTLVYARSKAAPVVTGLVQTADRRIAPQSRYLQVLGAGNIGLFNLTTDADDFIRRQRLFFPSADDSSQGLYSVAFLLAKTYRPELVLPAETVYIDYTADETAFPRRSFAQVYQRIKAQDRSYLQRNFKGKIVLIGQTDSLTQDRHPTPLYYLIGAGPKRTPGVEILAQTVSTLLAGRFFAETGPAQRFLIYLALALLVTALTVYASPSRLPVLIPAVVLGWLVLNLTAFVHYFILPAVGGLTALLLGFGGAFSYRHWIVDREKRKIRAVFQRYLPDKVVRKLLASRDEEFFRGENRRLCLMFTDIRGFTTYSEKRPPAEVVGRLNEYFAAMSAIIASEGGAVDKFLGDGIMAFFGAFDDQGRPSLAGARAALKMLAELDRLNAAWSTRGLETFRIGIGLHTGHVMIGNIGSPNKMEYTVIGDAVNLASRLQDKTKDLGEAIVISREVYHDLADEALVEDRGLVDIKGRAQTRVYALKGLAGLK